MKRFLLAAVVGLASRAHEAEAQYNWAPPSTYSFNTAIPHTGFLVFGGPIVFSGAVFYANLGGPICMQVFDANTTPPASGAQPVWSSPSTATNAVGADVIPPGGLRMNTGLVVIPSSTCDVFTDTGINVPGYVSVLLRRIP